MTARQLLASAVMRSLSGCTPGAYVFCRCQDRSEGTKLCQDATYARSYRGQPCGDVALECA